MARQAASRNDHPVESWIARVLWTGVVLSSAVILAGLVLALLGPQPAGVHGALDRAGPWAHVSSFHSLLRGLAGGDPFAVLQLGLLLLILTPVVRVAVTVALFALQGDWIFATIAGIVLALLTLGLGGFGH